MSEDKLKELELQLKSLRYATNAELAHYLRTLHPEYADLNKSILTEITSVRAAGGHGYACCYYEISNKLGGYIDDTTMAIFLLDYAREKCILHD